MTEIFTTLTASIALVFMSGLLVAHLVKEGFFNSDTIAAFVTLITCGFALYGYWAWTQSISWDNYHEKGNKAIQYGEWDRALVYYREAIDFGIKQFGPRDVRVANSKIALATLYEEYDQEEKARKEYREAIDILEKNNVDAKSPVLKEAQKRLHALGA